MKMDSISLSRLPRPMDTLLLLLFLVTPDVSSEGSELFSCDFENDLCGLIQGTDDHFDWTRHQGPAATGPSEAYHGEHYIYAEANNHPWQGANLRTRNLDYQGLVCVTFAYYMNGQDYHYLRISIPSGDNIATIRNDQGNHWNKFVGRVTLAKGNGIEFRASIPNNNKRDIAVDDLVIRAGSCKDVVSLPYHCSFESGLCGMTQGFDDQFDWTRYNRSTGSSYTGPRNASDGEWFIYIEVNTPRIYNGYTAVIETPAFNHTGTLCLRFNYHMYGKQYWYAYNVGTLIALHEGGTTSTGVFVKTGHMGNTWLSAAVNVTGFQPGDWITFRATRGNSIFGDIAVDNINIATGGCRDCHIFNGSCQHLCIPESTGDRCACHHGYRLDGDTMCTDIDECFDNKAGCSQLCNNTDGGFTCHCNDGFRLGKDNSTCQDIDECSEKIAACSQRCKNTFGGFTCHCNEGFLLDKDNTTCQDIDECSENMTGCFQHCNNTVGGFTCHCDEGFILDNDKTTCQVRQEAGASVAVIAGAAVAAAVVVSIVIIIFVLFIFRRSRRKANREVEPYAYVNVGRSRDLEMDTMDKGGSVKPASANEPSLEVGRPSQMYATVIPKAQRPQKADTLDKNRPASSTGKPEIADSTLSEKPAENAGKTDGSSDESMDAESVTEEQTDEGGSISEIPLQGREPNEEQHDDTAIEHSGLYYNLPPTATIQTSVFPVHVKKLQKNKGFEKEYKRLPSGKLSDWEAATRQDLKAKNRFKNIYPYDSNRVRMNTIPGDPNSDYINASHIQGFSENDRYIASHGPTPLTKHDFWRMIWEQNVTLVVMVTNLLEDGTVRCVKYWPDKEEVMTYDDITVTLTKEEKLPDFTMRVWKLTKAGEEERVVEQCHYTSWPDHGVPEDATSILRFHERVRKRMKPGKPTVVHCSAGVGRTGTFIAIDYLLQQAAKEDKVDVYKCVSDLRQQKVQMVQSQRQYEFIHDALLEALIVGDTTIPCDTLESHLESADEALQLQFQLLDELKPKYTPEDRATAFSKTNKDKNLTPQIIPRESRRVILTSRVHRRTDYINAVFVHSYQKKNAFVVTQMPLEDTMIDFWRMIHDLRCDTIVLIGQQVNDLLPGKQDEVHTVGQYHIKAVPGAKEGATEEMKTTAITVERVKQQPTYENVQTMSQNKETVNKEPEPSSQSVSCRVVEVAASGPTDLPASLLTRLYAIVHGPARGENTFIVFVCKDGGELSGVAVASFSMFDMMSLDSMVDVFHITKQVKDSRPEFIPTLDQYKQLHDIAGEYNKQFGMYANFR